MAPLQGGDRLLRRQRQKDVFGMRVSSCSEQPQAGLLPASREKHERTGRVEQTGTICATINKKEGVLMAKRAIETARPKIHPTPKPAKHISRNPQTGRFKEALTVAENNGLLSGSRTHVIRGRMPVGLVEQAKRKSGISSDSKLIEVALANIAVADDYAQWLLAQRGSVSPELDLEF